jgi:hypothetical protein
LRKSGPSCISQHGQLGLKAGICHGIESLPEALLQLVIMESPALPSKIRRKAQVTHRADQLDAVLIDRMGAIGVKSCLIVELGIHNDVDFVGKPVLFPVAGHFELSDGWDLFQHLQTIDDPVDIVCILAAEKHNMTDQGTVCGIV